MKLTPEQLALRAGGYTMVNYSWSAATGIARMTYERTVAGVREREVIEVHHMSHWTFGVTLD